MGEEKACQDEDHSEPPDNHVHAGRIAGLALRFNDGIAHNETLSPISSERGGAKKLQAFAGLNRRLDQTCEHDWRRRCIPDEPLSDPLLSSPHVLPSFSKFRMQPRPKLDWQFHARAVAKQRDRFSNVVHHDLARIAAGHMPLEFLAD